MLLCKRHLFCPVCNKEQNRHNSLPSDQNSTQGARWELWRWWSTLRGPVYKCVYDGKRERGQLASPPPTTFEWVFKLIYYIDLSLSLSPSLLFHTHTCLSVYCYLLLLLPFDYWFLLFDDFIVAFVSIHCTLIKCCFIFSFLVTPFTSSWSIDQMYWWFLLLLPTVRWSVKRHQAVTYVACLIDTYFKKCTLSFFLSLSLLSLPSSYSSMYY